MLSRFTVGAVLPEALPQIPLIDPTIPAWEMNDETPLQALVSAVDEEGNEIAGLVLPTIAAGAAAYTGWNARQPVPGLPSVMYEFIGSRLPLQTGAEPPTAEVYEARARAAAQHLASDGILLQRDVETAVTHAMTNCK